MKTVTIQVPDSIADIPVALEELRKQLAAIDAQRSAVLGAIQSIQRQCPHTNATHGTDIDGGSSMHCNTCGLSR